MVDVIQSIEVDHSEFGDIIRSCRSLLIQRDSYSVSYVRRQANEVVHALAMDFHFSTCPTFYYDIPNFLLLVMKNVCLIEAH